MLPKVIGLTFLAVFQIFLHSQTTAEKILDRLREQEKKDQIYSRVLTNLEIFNLYDQKSNELRVPLMDTNTLLIGKILAESDFFGNDLFKKSEFFNLAAEHYFYRVDAPPGKPVFAAAPGVQARKRAFELWQEIIEMDLKLLASAEQGSWEGRSTALSPFALASSLRMDRYRFETSEPSEKTPFLTNYSRYAPYATNGYDPGSELRLNVGIYFLLIENLPMAEKTFSLLENKNQHYEDALLALRARVSTNDGETYRKIKDYLFSLRSRDFFLHPIEDKYFDYANSLLMTRDLQGKSRPLTYHNLPVDNQETVRRALEAYDKSVRGKNPRASGYLNTALVYLRLERYPNAILALEEALKRNPDYSVLYTMGLTQMRVGDFPKAYQYFIEAKYHDESKGELFNNLAHCSLFLTNREEKQKAIGWVNRALELDGKNFQFYVTKADVLKSQNEHSGYTNQLRTAITVLQNLQSTNYEEYKKIYFLDTTNEVPSRIRNSVQELQDKLGLNPLKKF